MPHRSMDDLPCKDVLREAYVRLEENDLARARRAVLELRNCPHRARCPYDDKPCGIDDIINGLGHQAKETPPAPARPPVVDPEQTMREQAAARGGTVVASHMGMVGLQRIKKELGDRWSRYAERVEEVALTVLEKRLTDEDVFQRTPDGGYLICFGTLSEHAAAFKAQAISREIQARILGNEALQDDFDLPAELLAEAAEMSTETVTAEVSDEEGDPEVSIADLILGKIEQEREAQRRRANRILQELAESPSVETVETWVRPEQQGKMWLAQPDAESRFRIEQLMLATGSPPAIQRQLDTIYLGGVASRLFNDLDPGVAIVLVGVSYETMAAPEHREAFMNVCRELPDSVRQRVGFLLRDVPAGTHESRVAQCLQFLRPFSRLQVVELSLRQVMHMDFDALGARLITLPFAGVQTLLTKPEGNGARALTNRIRKARCIITDVPDHDSATLLRRLGVDLFTYDPLGPTELMFEHAG